MKHLRFSNGLRIFTLLAAVASICLLPNKAAAAPDGLALGGTYVTTVTDSTGAFASRGVITLHADHTMSVLDSGQGGPYFFTSQLGSWAFDSKGGLVARTIDFDYPPNADVARLDYKIAFEKNGSKISGTITLTSFPLTADPNGSGGTLEGTFTFTGVLVQP